LSYHVPTANVIASVQNRCQ